MLNGYLRYSSFKAKRKNKWHSSTFENLWKKRKEKFQACHQKINS